MQNTENKFKHDGLWYISIEEESCRGCDFGGSQQTCTAPDPELSDVPPCGANRQDNRNVIFVRSDVSAEISMENVYDALLSGALSVPTKGGE